MSIPQSKRDISFERKNNVPGPGAYNTIDIETMKRKTSSARITPPPRKRGNKDKSPGPG